jgi:hypothetical protein
MQHGSALTQALGHEDYSSAILEDCEEGSSKGKWPPTSAALLSGAMSDSNKFMAFHLLRERRGYLSVSAMVPYLTQMLSKLEM